MSIVTREEREKDEVYEIPARSQAVEVSGSGKSEGRRVPAAAQRFTWPSLRTAAVWASALVIFIFPATASAAANLKPETLEAWKECVLAARTQVQDRLSPDRPFLE
jgi:hypothetical protein